MLNKASKIILAVSLYFFINTAAGQNNTNSPYSVFGIGDLFNTGYGRSIPMGGAATPLVSINSLNPSNPATYVGIMPGTFVFEVNTAGNFYSMKTADKSFSKFDGNLRSLAIGFPVTKWWKAGFGISPLSSVGYEIQQLYLLTPDTISLANIYKGEGGVNTFYFDNAFQLHKTLSIGIKAAFLFGSIDRLRTIYSYNNYSVSAIEESNRFIFNAFSFGAGIHFHRAISPSLYLNLGANYNFNTDLDGENARFITSTVEKNGSKFLDTLYNASENSLIEIPQSISIGASLIVKQKLELAIDYQQDNWSESKFFDEDQNLANNQRYSFGMEYTPDFSSSKYLKLIRYRAGINYIKSYLVVENTQLTQKGASLGFGFPLKNGAFANLGFYYFQRSVPGKDILTENNFQINLNFSFKANWFIKRHFY